MTSGHQATSRTPARLSRAATLFLAGLTATAGAVLAAEKERLPEPDGVPPRSPAQFNPDPGGQQNPLQSNSPPIANPLPTLFEPVVPVRAPEFTEDLPPRTLTLPRRAVKMIPDQQLDRKFEPPEYDLSNNGIGLLPGFTPMVDRWRLPGSGLGNMPFKRYKNPALESTYGYRIYSTFDPYKPSLLKGDFPIIGEEIFLNLTIVDQFEIEARRVPLPSGVSYARPGNYEFFGRGDGYTISNNLSFTIELFKGETQFKPVEWAIRITPVFNVNYTELKENLVKPDPRGSNSGNFVVPGPVTPGTINNPGDIGLNFGQFFIPAPQDLAGTGYTRRFRNSVNLQEAFIEYHIRDLSLAYDFISLKLGAQPFNSDFRGFIFNDTNLGLRVFGNLDSNRWQYNFAAFSMREKDTFSNLNTFNSRNQEVFIVNAYRQDFIWEGYTAQWSIHVNNDHGQRHYDRLGNITRPTPIGSVKNHSLDAFYFGWTGDGHIGWVNITHAFYWVVGRDNFNGLAGKPVEINAQMFALELSYDKDWLRPKFSFLYASGDNKATDRRATGFDSIIDSPGFIGNPFSYYARQGISLGNTGTLTKTPNSIFNSFRTSKFEGQSSFVNPGTLIAGLGLDADITPRLKAVFNANWIRFVSPDALKTVLFVPKVDRDFGYDFSFGFFYRPTLTQNIVISAGFGAFIPGAGYRDINRQLTRPVPGYSAVPGGKVDRFLYSGLFAITLTY